MADAQGSVNGGFQTGVRVFWGNEIPLPSFYLSLSRVRKGGRRQGGPRHKIVITFSSPQTGNKENRPHNNGRHSRTKNATICDPGPLYAGPLSPLLSLTSFLPPFYLFLTSFLPLFKPQFNLCFVTNLELRFGNHGLQTLGIFCSEVPQSVFPQNLQILSVRFP